MDTRLYIIQFGVMLCFVARSMAVEVEFECKEKVVDIDNTNIITDLKKHCGSQMCIPKCCKRNEVLTKIIGTKDMQCNDISANSYNVTREDFNKIKIYESSFDTTRVGNQTASKKNFMDFPLVQVELKPGKCAQRMSQRFKYYVLEESSVLINIAQAAVWFKRTVPHFCTELLYEYNSTKSTSTPILITSREKLTKNDFFIGITSVISALFLVLTFTVFCLLPQLRNIGGMVQMAYMVALFATYVGKACWNFNTQPNKAYCTGTSILFYFGFLSSFFWLNTWSLDIWWTIRGHRYQRSIHRRGVRSKFRWYSLGAWGIPLLMTIACIIVDFNEKNMDPTVPKPSFYSCMNGGGILHYLIIPIGVLTIINIILFFMTIYNIWLIKRSVNNIGSNTQNTNRFLLFLKMSLMMGVSWILELIMSQIPANSLNFWVKSLVPLYNFLMGLVIFLIFVCNKTTLRMLCARFNIKCRFLEKDLKNNCSARSTSTTLKSSIHKNSNNRSKSTADTEVEMDEISELQTEPVHNNDLNTQF